MSLNLFRNRAERRPRKVARFVGVAPFLLGLAAPHPLAAQLVLPPADQAVAYLEENNAPGDPAQDTAEAKELLEKVSKEQRLLWIKWMDEEIAAVAAATSPDAPQKKALEVLSGQAVDKCLAGWTASVGPAVAMLRRSMGNGAEAPIDDLLQNFTGVISTKNRDEIPSQSALWTSGVQGILTPAQRAAWARADAARHEEWKAGAEERLQPFFREHRTEIAGELARKAADAKRALSFAPERAHTLEDFAHALTDGLVATLEGDVGRALATAPRQNLAGEQLTHWLAQTLARGQPDTEKLWTAGLQQLLSSPEQKELKQQQARKATRWREAKSLCLLAYLDEKVAFTPQQRAQLLPVARRLVPKLARAGEGEEDDQAFARSNLLSLAAKAREQELKAILDPVQNAHWRDACKAAVQEEDSNAEPPPAPKEGASPLNRDEDDPEEYELQLSAYLNDKAWERKKEQMAKMLIQAEDASRAIPLPKEQLARLATAARGATEEALREWRVELEQELRATTDHYEGGNLKSHLAAIDLQMDVFTSDLTSLIEEKPLWKNALQTLSPDQLGKWHKSVLEREAFRETAATSTLLACFDQLVGLSALQRTSLEPEIKAIVHEYGRDLNIEDDGDGTPWFCNQETCLLPLLAMENPLKSLLGPDQWELWTKSKELAQCAQYWSQVKEAHDTHADPQRSRN